MAKPFRNLNSRIVAALLGAAALILMVGVVACGAASSGEGNPEPAALPAAAGQQTDAAPAEIAVRSRLVFPRKAELSFDTAGEVAEILVAAGDRVTQGQTLARLKTDNLPSQEEELARLRYDVAQTRDTIKQLRLDFSGEPLLAAQRAETVAGLEYANRQAADFLADIDQNYDDALVSAQDTRDQAILNLDTTQDDLEQALDDLEVSHQQTLAQAFQSRADAELALEQAEKRLDEYTGDVSDDAVRGQDRVAKAELALDQARDALQDYRDNLPDDTVRGQDRVAKAELALDQAQDALDDYPAEHEREVIRARTRVGAAEVALDDARDARTQFYRNPVIDLQSDDKGIDLSIRNRLETNVELAAAELEKAQEDLAELEAGPDPLRLEELQSSVTVAEVNLAQAKEDLAELGAVPDPLRLQELQSSITVAEVNLARAKEDLAELEEGPDSLVQAELQAAVNLAQAVRSQAEKNLEEQLEGPDRLNIRRLSVAVELSQTRLGLAERELNELLADGPDRDAVPLREAEIAARQSQIDDLNAAPDPLQIAALEAGIIMNLERMDDILEDLEKAELRAPFDGIVYLVNAAVDDRVNQDSRILEILDPGEVEIAGLVDANDIPLVRVGSAARVSIAALPDRELTATVTAVADEPGTERGIISYPVTLRVNLPAGVELPPRLSTVTSVIMP